MKLHQPDFPLDYEEAARFVVERLHNHGFTAYYAGGWVRDLLLGQPSEDIDIATSATPDQVKKLFKKTVPVGLAFGSVVVVFAGHSFEVTTFRTEGGYTDGRHPDRVTFASPQEDAQRRSFTVNGLFYDPLTDTLADYVSGEADLEAKIIRTIGKAKERFAEDRLRMMRAVRFSTRFDFQLEETTKQAIIEQADTLLPAVAYERIWQEFKKMAFHPKFADFLISLHALGLLPQIFPELKAVSVEELERRLISLSNFPEKAPTLTRLAECFFSPDETFPIDSEEKLQALQAIGLRLKTSRKELQWLTTLATLDRLLAQEEKGSCDPLAWVTLYAHPQASIFLQLRAARLTPRARQTFLMHHKRRQTYWLHHIRRHQRQRPLVTSQILAQHGIQPGKKMGELLQQGEKIATQYNLSNVDEVLQRLDLSLE